MKAKTINVPIQEAFDKLQYDQKWTAKAVEELQRIVNGLQLSTHRFRKQIKELEKANKELQKS